MIRFLILFLMFFGLEAYAKNAKSFVIYNAASMGASVASSGVDVSKADTISVQAVWAGGGAPNGSFEVQISNDDVANVASVTNWSTYPSSAIAITTDGDLSYHIANVGFRYMRIFYTRTGGTATIDANMVIKGEDRL